MEAIGNLAGGVAHDLNNLLAAILGLSFVLQADIDEESPLQQDVGAIVGACQQGRDMIRNLLGFARKGKYRRESVSLNKVARDVVSLLERTIPKMVTIRTELDPDLERVEGDPSQINHALMNLGINASDAMAGKGTLTFATDTILLQEGEMDGRHLGLEPGRYVRLRVKDTGIGMDQEVQRQVFEPFFTTKAQGTGLGLSMVYGTMKNHGGSLFLESEVDRGSTFTLLLPTLDEIPCKKETPNTSCVKGQGLVLVVDDEKYVRNGLRGMLVRLGFDVLLAQDGQEATALFDQHCDTLVLVLLDLLMPHMDGEETFEHLHQVKPEVPVLLSSGHSAEDVVSRLLEKGADGIIHKPYDMNELSHAIAGVFAASRS